MSRPAVLVVAYRNPDQLGACLDSIAEHLPDLPVLVHDNSGAHAAELDSVVSARPEVRWSRGGPNIGFAAAVTALADQVPEADLLLVNPDAVLTSPLVGTLDALDDPTVAAAAPLDVDSSSPGARPWDVAHRSRGIPRALVSAAGHAPRLRGTPWSDLYRRRPREAGGYLTGACLAVARHAWATVGPFDDEFFLYGEESEWQGRARRAGLRLVLVDEPGPIHAAGGTVADDPDARRRSHDLLRANVALELQKPRSARRGDLYLAGTTFLDHVQRSKRRARAARPRPDRPSIVFTINRLVYGGAERHHALLATELDRRGWDVTIVALQRFGPLIGEVPHAVRVIRQPWWAPDADLAAGPALLVSGDTNTETGFGTLWRRRRRDRRWLVGAHVPPDPDAPTYSGRLAKAMRRADGFVALAERHRAELEAHQDVATRWFVAPNGIAHAADLVDVPARPAPGSPLRLVMLSRIVEHKNPHLLIEALGRLRDLPWTLDVFGDGPDRERLEAQTPADLLDRVRWRGWSAGPGPAMAEADVVCLPSRAEAFPLTILEAFARRLPVIASASCAVPEMLDHGAAGIVVDDVTVDGWEAALRPVVEDPSRLAGLGDRGLELMRERYTIEAMADAYEAAFEAVWS